VYQANKATMAWPTETPGDIDSDVLLCILGAFVGGQAQNTSGP